MLKKSLFLLTAAIVLILGVSSVSYGKPMPNDPPPPPVGDAMYTENVIYLPHGYFCTVKTDEYIESEVQWLAALGFRYQFCNITAFNSDGTMDPDNTETLADWIRVSRETDPAQLLIGYVSGTKDLVDDITKHQIMIDYCVYLCDDVDGFGMDGINIDYEPIPYDDPIYLQFMHDLKTALGSKRLTVCTPLLNWSDSFINQVSYAVDEIDIMCYDTLLGTQQEYIDLMSSEVVRYSANMNPNCDLVPLQAAYSKSRWHNPAIENVITGSTAIDEAVGQGADVAASGVWWWYEMTIDERYDWLEYWVRPLE